MTTNEKWTADDTAYRPGGLPQPEQKLVAWVRNLTDPQPHCVTDLKYMSAADVDVGVQYVPLYTVPKILCGCGDQIVPDDGAECGTCVTVRNATMREDIGDRFAHRLAVMLECALLDPNGTWNDAHQLLDEYRQALRERDEALGIPYVSAFGKD